MSDLISRSELLKRFCINKDGHRIPERDCDNFEVTVSVKDIKTIIKEQPTAYDIDKVIEKLEERKALYEKLVGYESKNGTSTEKNQHIKAIDVLNDAIEIVKQGGVSEEVCKWRIVDRPHNLPIYNTSCGKIRMQYTTGVDIYCNGCGKKIKVVE